MKAKKQKTFAQRAEKIMKKYEARPDDTAAQDSKNRELAVLKQEQEMYKQNKAMEAIETIQSMGYGDMLASNEPQQGPPQPSQEEMMAMQQQQNGPMHQMPDGSMMPGEQHGQQMAAYGGHINRYKNGGNVETDNVEADSDTSKSCPTGYYWSSVLNKCVSKEELRNIYHDMAYTDRNSASGVYSYHPKKLEEGYDGSGDEGGATFRRTVKNPNITHNSRMQQAYSDYMKSDPGFVQGQAETLYHMGSQGVGAVKSMFGLKDDSVGEAINKPKWAKPTKEDAEAVNKVLPKWMQHAYGGRIKKYDNGGEFEAESVNPWIAAGQLAPDVYGLAQNLRPGDDFTSKKMDSNIYTDTSAEEAAIDRATGSAGAGLRENLRRLGSAGAKSAAVTGATQIATGAGAQKAGVISQAQQLDDRTNLGIEAQNNALINQDAQFNMQQEGARRTATEQYLRNIGQETVPGIALDQTQNEMQAAIIKALGSGDYAYEGGIEDLILAFQGGQAKKGE